MLARIFIIYLSVFTALGENEEEYIEQIPPGFNWCGPGNRSINGEVAFFKQVDSSCKKHDECGLNLSWEPNETKLGITNPLGYTLSKCDCDRDFFTCLDDAREYRFPGRIIKFIFKVVIDKCAEYERKLICSEFFLGRCQLYKIDPKSSTVKFWQIIDNRYLKWIS